MPLFRAAPSLRAATEADRGFVLELSQQCFGHLGDYRDILGGWFAHPGVRTTLAVDGDGQPIGYAMQALLAGADDAPPVAHLVGLAVVPEARRQGVARRLLAGALALARTDARHVGAADLIRLEVAADNPGARTLFAGAGFVRRPRGDGRYPNGQRFLSMQRPLTDGDAPSTEPPALPAR